MAKYLLRGPGLRVRVIGSSAAGYWRGEGGKTFLARWEGTMADILVDKRCSAAAFDTAAAEAEADGGVIEITIHQWNAAFETRLWPELLAVSKQDWTGLARSLSFVRGGGGDPERISVDQECWEVEVVFPTNLGRILGANSWRIKKYASVARSCGWKLQVNDGGRRDAAQATFDTAHKKAKALLEKLAGESPKSQKSFSLLINFCSSRFTFHFGRGDKKKW